MRSEPDHYRLNDLRELLVAAQELGRSGEHRHAIVEYRILLREPGIEYAALEHGQALLGLGQSLLRSASDLPAGPETATRLEEAIAIFAQARHLRHEHGLAPLAELAASLTLAHLLRYRTLRDRADLLSANLHVEEVEALGDSQTHATLQDLIAAAMAAA